MYIRWRLSVRVSGQVFVCARRRRVLKSNERSFTLQYNSGRLWCTTLLVLTYRYDRKNAGIYLMMMTMMT